MKKIIAKHRFKNNKSIQVGVCDKSPIDLMFLELQDKDGKHTWYLRPDEVVLIIKLLSELILKRVINYEVNLGKKTSKDY